MRHLVVLRSIARSPSRLLQDFFAQMEGGGGSRPYRYWLLLFLVSGLALRVIWPLDMEWKSDEMWTFQTATNAVTTGQMPHVGMESSAGLANPALSIWVFVFVRLFATTPVAMAQSVQWSNVLAILAFLFLVIPRLAVGQKEYWYWGLVLAAVGPMPILFSRKIWPPDVFPLLLALFYWAYSYRGHWFGALAAGLIGALLGQIQMSGFILALAALIVTWLLERRTMRWAYCGLGALLGAVPLLTWLVYFLSRQPRPWSFHVPSASFYRSWFLNATGLQLEYSLGGLFPAFLKSYWTLPRMLHVALALIGVYAVIQFGRHFRHVLADTWILTTLVGVGLITVVLSVLGYELHPYHVIVLFPFPQILLARLLLPRRALLAAVVVSQLALSSFFLHFIHTSGGAADVDYGTTYRLQLGR